MPQLNKKIIFAKKILKKKSILVINKTGLSAPFCDGLSRIGYDVEAFFKDDSKVFTVTLHDRMFNIFHRFFFKDRQYLKRAEQRFQAQKAIKRSRLLAKNFDYAIFFRADLYPEEMIKNIRKISKIMITDQYDGMAGSQKILDYKKYFNRCFVFDPDDYAAYKDSGFLPITNCWFPDNENIKEIAYDFFYVGVGMEERRQNILRLQTFLEKKYSVKAFLTIPHYQPEKVIGGVSFCHKAMSYKENIAFVKSSRVLIDFKLYSHNGLSFRFFEALYYGKKIITDNATVRFYDFYHPDNIFITNYEGFEGLEEFLRRPVAKIRLEIINRYGLNNWIRYILDEEPFLPITLPKIISGQNNS